ncbi:MAG: hypothetical protein ACTHN8_18225 [Angustibacter sp.]
MHRCGGRRRTSAATPAATSSRAARARRSADLHQRRIAAIAGITDADAQLLDQALGIKPVRDLGSKYFAAAGVLVALSRHV